LTTIRTQQQNYQQEVGPRINRRFFLAASGAGAAICTVPAILPLTTENECPVGPHSLYWNTVHIRWQLRTYRDHFLPWLLRRNRRDTYFWYTGLTQADSLELSRFRATVDGLLESLDAPGTPTRKRSISAILRPARVSLCDSARMHLLREHNVDREFVTSRCLYSGPGLIWQWRCRSMGFYFPSSVLESRWREIRELLRLPANAEPSDLFSVRPRRLIRCFRRLSREDYFRLAYPLVQLFPAVPWRFFAIPDQWKNGRRRVADRPALYGGPGIRDQVSQLMGLTLEFLANDDFMRLWPLVKRAEMCGSWMPFIAGQVLDILYQKTLSLTWLQNSAPSLASVSGDAMA
jgi:hypothetical protein